MNSPNGRKVSILGAGVVATLLAAVAALAAAPGGQPGGSAVAAVDQHGPTILQTYKGHFLIGTAADPPGGFSDDELNLIKENFNCITPENYLKPAPIHPLEDVWSFKRPDAMVAWCAANNIAVHGHTLMWHSQTNPWFFEGGDRETVIKRLKDHITTLVGHYKGKIRSWDVVNEAIDGNAPNSENLRTTSQWLRIIGPDFLTMAFKFAHDADPDAKLFYNDYNIESGVKHESSMLMLKRLIKDGAPIYGVGIQGHWSTNGLPYAALDKAIADYGSIGLKVAISELDITIAGQSGGQLGPGGPGGAGRRGRAGTAPATAPAAFLSDGDGTYFIAAPAGRGGRGGAGRGGRGGAAAPPVNPAETVLSAISDLSDDQKTKLTAASSDLATKLADWQKSSQRALLIVQPQYSPGQVAYNHEVEELNAEQAVQTKLRDDIINQAEPSLMAILTPAQAQKWQASRLAAQVTSQFAGVNLTDAQQATINGFETEYAGKLAAAKDATSVGTGKADFARQVLAALDESQRAQLLTPGGGAGGGPGRGRGGPQAAPSASALKTQADAYARIFAIFEKHKDVMDRVTFWGINDARSWRTGQNPLIFDASNQRKPAYLAVVEALVHPDPNLAAPQ